MSQPATERPTTPELVRFVTYLADRTWSRSDQALLREVADRLIELADHADRVRTELASGLQALTDIISAHDNFVAR